MFRKLRLVIVPILACAIVLSGTSAARAAAAIEPPPVDINKTSFTEAEVAAIQTWALQMHQEIQRSLETTGSAEVLGVDGVLHRISIGAGKVIVDGTGTGDCSGLWVVARVSGADMGGVGAGSRVCPVWSRLRVRSCSRWSVLRPG